MLSILGKFLMLLSSTTPSNGVTRDPSSPWCEQVLSKRQEVHDFFDQIRNLSHQELIAALDQLEIPHANGTVPDAAYMAELKWLRETSNSTNDAIEIARQQNRVRWAQKAKMVELTPLFNSITTRFAHAALPFWTEGQVADRSLVNDLDTLSRKLNLLGYKLTIAFRVEQLMKSYLFNQIDLHFIEGNHDSVTYSVTYREDGVASAHKHTSQANLNELIANIMARLPAQTTLLFSNITVTPAN